MIPRSGSFALSLTFLRRIKDREGESQAIQLGRDHSGPGGGDITILGGGVACDVDASQLGSSRERQPSKEQAAFVGTNQIKKLNKKKSQVRVLPKSWPERN